MNQTIINIGGENLDLSPGTIVTQTKKGFDVGNILERYGDITNQFTVPLTENNKRIYENLQNVSSDSDKPYTQQTAKITQNGIEVVSYGLSIIERARLGFDISIKSRLSTLLETINDGRKLTDLDFSGLKGPFGRYNVEDYRDASTGVAAPLIDYGRWNGFDIDTESYLPSMYYHTVFDKILSEVGYTASGSILATNKHLKKIIAFSRDSYDYDPSFTVPFKFIALSVGTQNFVAPISSTPQFTNVTLASAYYDGVSSYTNGSTFGIKSHFFASLNFQTTGAPGVTLQMLKNAEVIATYVLGDAGQWVLDTKVLFPDGVILIPGDTITIDLTLTGSGSDTVDILVGSTFNSGPLTSVYSESGDDVDFGKLLPDMTQFDFIKDFIIGRGLMFEDDQLTSNIEFKSFNEVIADRANAKDWTSKSIRKQKDISFSTDSYAQSNKFTYEKGDKLIPDDYGSGSFAVENTNLNPEQDIYNSPWTASFTGLYSKYLSTIPLYNEDGEWRFNTTALTQLGAQFSIRISQDVTKIFSIGDRVFYKSDNGVYNGYYTVEAISYTSPNTSIVFREPLYISPATTGFVIKKAPDFDISPGMRLLLVRDPYATDSAIKYADTFFGDYLIGYFEDPDQTDNLPWQQDIDEGIGLLVDSVQKMKIVNHDYMLTELDIANHSFLFPIFDTDAYYLVNEIPDFIQGVETRCSLLKV